MSWHTNSPDGTISVKANTPNMLENTTYTKTTMNVDHYWDTGANYDGRHNQVQMPNKGGDATLGTQMDGAFYIKPVSASNARIQGFYRNTNGIYQFIPSFQTGTVAVTSTSSYVTVVAVEDESYGQIFMFTATNAEDMAMGFFKASGGLVQSYNCQTTFSGSTTPGTNLKFGNGAEANGLNIRARRQSGPSATYQYRIVYWGI